jgi:hypothetical protein
MVSPISKPSTIIAQISPAITSSTYDQDLQSNEFFDEIV